ncbi:putative adenine-specific methylase MJECS02 [Planktothrix agardhii]|jgi:tRNA1(Val) A37 N6-methylase TrmN6|uniref:site-specific DNA-methyltransferase (adenine-specific) n=1 Tax=Planktothrix agardhii TaxID=1160 RepID=A0A1J1JD51_PLAAG|nr:TaqI-like C-terminal specificity domain-containing protein [Planktothrix agardhii]CAD5957045.1 putative adenine-specific methylase MJECS02 [Planktothrix agardhii]CUM59398.1 putative Eco57I restriction endonuclease family protein [Planktothrix agardhii]
MTQPQIQDIFNQRYNQAKWKQFLGETFANAQLLSTPETLTGIDINVASQVQKLGYILLDENGIERQIGVYEVTLAPDIILERNRVGLINLLRKYWQNIDAAFIAYHRPESANWRFSYVSELTGYDAEGESIKIKTEPKRYTYLLGEGESIRTAVERFERIIKKGSKVTLDDVKESFSVEKLSKTFFDEYKKHYDIFCQYMVSEPGIYQTIFNGDEKAIRDFNKKLLGRIVFLYFIQKKGWLGVPKNESWGKGDHNFLTNQFESFAHPELFYQDFLSVLFFDTLNTKRPDDLIELVAGKPCRIPFLNGGLFEEENKNHRNLIFDTNLFKNLFNFFDQYNFTIYEDDPNDHTVAVDPEMLGHIFENLLEDNKDKGAYYTPKEIVHYMCQESLIEYLTTWFENQGYDIINDVGFDKFSNNKQIDRILIEKLLKKNLDDQDQKLIKQYSAEFNQALDRVKICDPAIGSGAFPMGLLHEIFTAKQTLHTFEFGNTTNFNASGVKLNIIQNSIYGVDIERGAVDIARLRFWLSLIVDEPEPKALPNLDYKIVVGNSLVSKLGDDIIDIDWEMKGSKQGNIFVDVFKPEEILKQISQEQKEFFSPDSDKKKLAADIRNLKIDLLISQLELMVKSKGMETKPTSTGKTLTKQTEIYLQTIGWKNTITQLNKLKTKPELPLHFFDWKLDFPEVMNPYLFAGDKDSPEVATTNKQINALNAQIDAINLHLSQHNINIHLCHLQANIVQSQIVIIKQQLLEIEIQQNSSMGFDIVIGNPPYVFARDSKSKGITQADKEYYPKHYQVTEYQLNLYPLFIEKGYNLLKNKGLLDYITPNNWLTISSNKNLRKFILDNSHLKIVNFYAKVFESADVDSSIILFEKSQQNKSIELFEYTDNFYSIFETKTNYFLQQKDYIINIEAFKNTESLSLLEKIELQSIQIKTIADVKAGLQAYERGKGNPPQTEEIKENRVYHSTTKINDDYIKYLDGKDVCRYYLGWSGEYLKYGDNLASPRKDFSLFSTPRILVRQIPSPLPYSINACFTQEIILNDRNSMNIINLQENPMLILGIFNSKLISYWFAHKFGKLQRGIFPQFKVNELATFPIPKNFGNYQQPVIKLVDEILKKKKKDVKADVSELEQKIDNLVYKLYELTYEEVKITDPEFVLTEQEYDAIKIEY